MRWRLFLSFTLIALVSIASLLFVIRRSAIQEVRTFMFRGGMAGIEGTVAALENHFQAYHSWEGADQLLEFPRDNPGNRRGNRAGSQGFGGMMAGMMNQRLRLADAQGNLILDTDNANPTGTLKESELQGAISLRMGSETVGYLLPEGGLVFSAGDDTILLERLTRAAYIAAGVAIGFALLLAILLSSRLLKPVRALTQAASDLAHGDLTKRVAVQGNDELATLGQTFNQMATSLEEAEESRRAMTADIAHELRTPLTVVLGHSEALSEGQLPPDPETFDIIYDETKRLNRLVDDLRTLSLSDAGELRLNRSRISPLELLERSAAARKSEANTKGVSLLIETSPGLPEVKVDADRMTQVLVNLLDNALRYTLEGGRITLSGTQIPEGVRIAVEDTGPGIPEQDLPFLFDRFYRGDKSRQREEGGSGLGLAIARSLVESQGGRIRVESKVGVGAKFIIELPIAHEQTAEGESN